MPRPPHKGGADHSAPRRDHLMCSQTLMESEGKWDTFFLVKPGSVAFTVEFVL